MNISDNSLFDNATGILLSGTDGADLDDVEISGNNIVNSTFGIVATMRNSNSPLVIDKTSNSPGAPPPPPTPVYTTSIRILDNTIVGQGDDFGLAFYASEILGDFDSTMLNFNGASSLAALQALFPDDIFEADPLSLDLEDLFGPNASSETGFAGIVVSFNDSDDVYTQISGNEISGFKNGMYAAVIGAENIGINADGNASDHNIVLGDNTKYTLTGSNAGSFSHLW